ncbi:MAG: type I-C CRISPR-associated protein Cas5c [Gammaproteobacteria bacterium]|nr:type I-C CRISPR-associated protein Cas5c [Gammaproteobacteria bacterium]
MSYGVKLKVWGERACFTRPEMKVERVSYDVITPSAARGIVEAIHWKPAIRWHIDKITVLNPIRFETLRRNEVKDKISDNKVKAAMSGSEMALRYYVDDGDNRQQRATTLLRNVAYIIEAHFELTENAGPDDNERKHRDIFVRRARRGQCFHTPCLGNREFAASFEFVEEGVRPTVHPDLVGQKDLGWILHDFDFKNGITPHYFRAQMRDGVINVPLFKVQELKA